MRILIVEEALRLGNGHWPRYIADLAEGFRAEGDVVDVLGHKEANDNVKSVVHGVVPWLSRDCRVDRRSQGLIGGIRHNLSLKRELKAWLKKRGPYDWILSLSSRPKHLLAFAMLASAKRYSLSRFLLLFVLAPGQQDDSGKFRLSASNLFAKFCFTLLRPAVRRGQVVIAAETEGMRAEIEKFSELRTVLFPHPVEAAPPPKIEGTTKNTNIHERGEEVSTTDYVDGHGCGAGLGSASRAGAAFANPSKSELARDSENTSLTRYAGSPAVALTSEGGSAGGDQLADPVEFLDGKSPAGLPMVFEKHYTLCDTKDSDAFGNNSSSLTIRGSISESLDAGRSAFDTPAKPVVVVAPGLARYEKGSDILQEAIKLILSKEVASGERRVTRVEDKAQHLPRDPLFEPVIGRSVKFVMQWPEDFDLPNGRRCRPDPDLLQDERVKFSTDLLTGDAYWDFLRQADVVVLPYRIEAYWARVSRVAIEAAMLGKPMVYTGKTWIHEVAQLVGAGVPVADETPEGLAGALLRVISELERHQVAAADGVERVREFYSVSGFHRLLGELGGNRTNKIIQ
jgi:glycosyltransferase involved in cell wall biosynthesis